jgi:signal transduction histidine kinase
MTDSTTGPTTGPTTDPERSPELTGLHARKEGWLERWHQRRVRWHERWDAHRDRRHAHRDARHAARDERHARKAAYHAERHANREHPHPTPVRPTPLQTLKESLHLLLDLPIGIATFTVVVTMVSTGLSTLIIIIGAPILLGTALVIRWMANLERARLRWLLDADDLQSARWPGEGEPFLQRLWTCTKDPTVWKEGFYELALMPWGIATFTVTVVLWSAAIGGTFFATYFWALPESYAWYEVLGITVGGLVLLVVGPWLIHGIALLGRLLSRALLGVSARELTAKVEQLSASRKQTVDAATAERQRIERALHDGAQVRLTALAMELGRAKERLDSDPDGARELLDSAHDEAKRALVELRDLARGIHPAILTDRGLDAALTALAARSPIPVEVVVDLSERPTPALEATAYYVAAEGITNVMRHSGATRARVEVRRDGDQLTIEVQDDGRGGARIAEPNGVVPTGLRGLADRVAGVDGELVLSSPPGGPTVLRAELPCGS